MCRIFRRLLNALLVGLLAAPAFVAAQNPPKVDDPQLRQWFATFFGAPANAQQPQGEQSFEDLLRAYQTTPTPELAEKVIRIVAEWPERPPIPEEARRHFIRSVELFKLAKSKEEMKAVNLELADACHLAPWWPEARFNFALALETMGELPSAILNLKLYLLLKPAEADARDARDRIYAIEARQQQTSNRADAAKTATTTSPRRDPVDDPQPGGRVREPIRPLAQPIRFNLPHSKLAFDYKQTTAPWIREMKGSIKDAADLWQALEPLQPPPGAHGAYGLIGDDRLLGQPDGYGLEQLGRVARGFLKIDRIYVEQPAGWERIGVQSGRFTSIDQMNNVTLGWAFFDLRPNFEQDLNKLAASHR